MYLEYSYSFLVLVTNRYSLAFFQAMILLLLQRLMYFALFFCLVSECEKESSSKVEMYFGKLRQAIWQVHSQKKESTIVKTTQSQSLFHSARAFFYSWLCLPCYVMISEIMTVLLYVKFIFDELMSSIHDHAKNLLHVFKQFTQCSISNIAISK